MTPADSENIRLLLVDDEEDLVTFLAHRLRKRNMDVATYSNGEDALAEAGTRIFDVAVVDLKMPGMDGITVMEKLKELQPHVEIIMLTGHGNHDTAWEAGRLQAFRYLLKPYDFEELSGFITKAAQKRRSHLKSEFDRRLSELMTGTKSPRDIIEESDRLRHEYEQD
ncbi:MAG: response regulator [bacterium]|nr:response regulator [bacterium]